MKLGMEIKTKQIQKIQMGIKTAQFLDKNEKSFWNLVKEIESHPLFVKLYFFSPKTKAIKINPRKPILCPGIENMQPKIDIEAILQGSQNIARKLKRLGREKFIVYFLREDFSDLELAKISRLTLNEVISFRKNILDKIFLFKTFEHPNQNLNMKPQNNQVIAAVDKNLQIQYLQEKQRYIIDYGKIYNMRKKGLITAKEMKDLSLLKEKINSVNLRINLVLPVIEFIVKKQKEFLTTGAKDKLNCLEVKAASAAIGIHPSWLSRIIKNKYLSTPFGILPLGFFFITVRKLKQTRGINILKKILKNNKGNLKLTDKTLQKTLKQKYDMAVSRRTVNLWKNNISAAK